MNNNVFNTMINEYREACRDYYEARFGEKANVSYTIKNMETGNVITGSKSGCCYDKEAETVMRTLRRMMMAIFGNEVEVTLRKIRKEERKKEKEFFEENPQYIYYVTKID